ncbi:FMN-dependent NADH-azoreductase [Bradyrhizobium sp. LB8.2]|uniref:NAD(P)H-dependent oxidoreductase n=1 Tax=unclassified Bradyrhizobium TaxID=2631580 RepID=UPI003394DBC1
MKLLHLNSSILGGNSASRQLTAATVEQLAKATPALEIIHRDLAANPLSHLSGEHFAAREGLAPESAAVQDGNSTP